MHEHTVLMMALADERRLDHVASTSAASVIFERALAWLDNAVVLLVVVACCKSRRTPFFTAPAVMVTEVGGTG